MQEEEETLREEKWRESEVMDCMCHEIKRWCLFGDSMGKWGEVRDSGRGGLIRTKYNDINVWKSHNKPHHFVCWLTNKFIRTHEFNWGCYSLEHGQLSGSYTILWGILPTYYYQLILLYILGERTYDPIGLFSLHKRIFVGSILWESPADSHSSSNFKTALCYSWKM